MDLFAPGDSHFRGALIGNIPVIAANFMIDQI
jgi:hypothetical protein